MATFYVVAPEEVKALAEGVIRRWHERLNRAGVSIGYLFAHADRDASGQPKGPALKVHGYPAAALVKIVTLRDRVAGLPDALCVIDGDQWPDWTAERRQAVLDHELTHLHPTGDTDDANRPKLEMRLHDIQIGGFLEVIQRHEEEALEHSLLLMAGKAVRELTGKPWG